LVDRAYFGLEVFNKDVGYCVLPARFDANHTPLTNLSPCDSTTTSRDNWPLSHFGTIALQSWSVLRSFLIILSVTLFIGRLSFAGLRYSIIGFGSTTSLHVLSALLNLGISASRNQVAHSHTPSMILSGRIASSGDSELGRYVLD
jgi:hypothetical protein